MTAKNIKFDGIILRDITYVTAEVHKEIFSRCNPEFGDILYIKDGATSGIATINTLHAVSYTHLDVYKRQNLQPRRPS